MCSKTAEALLWMDSDLGRKFGWLCMCPAVRGHKYQTAGGEKHCPVPYTPREHKLPSFHRATALSAGWICLSKYLHPLNVVTQSRKWCCRLVNFRECAFSCMPRKGWPRQVEERTGSRHECSQVPLLRHHLHCCPAFQRKEFLLDGGLQQCGHSSTVGHCWADATKIKQSARGDVSTSSQGLRLWRLLKCIHREQAEK